MCGIFGCHLTEGVPNKEFFEELIKSASLRGNDGYGYTVINPVAQTKLYLITEKNPEKLTDKTVKEIAEKIHKNVTLGSFVLFQSRNAPETEEYTIDEKQIQPINIQDFIYVHNGSISDESVLKYEKKYNKKFDIDSETIGYAYIDKNRNFVEALEDISGSWSIIGVDLKQRMIYTAISWLAGGHGFLRGIGYVFHSYYDGIRKAFEKVLNKQELTYTRTWEHFYFHELPKGIMRIDMDTHLVSEYNYTHKFIHPTWKQLKKDNPKSKVYVLASSGIDSTTTTAFIKKFYPELDVELLHFDYGHKSSEAEKLAIRKIANRLNVPYRIIDINLSFESSMLTNKDLEINTAFEGMKTVSAWVPFRNGLFLAYAAAFAEEEILSNKYDYVYITGGFPNISESIYPDNGEKFIQAFDQFVTYGTLAGFADNRIRYMNPFEGLSKREELALLKHIDEELFSYTVSCDHAIVEDGEVKQCSTIIDGELVPACGSGILSLIAAKQINIKNNRKYYNKNDVNITLDKYITKLKEVKPVEVDVNDLIEKVKQRINSVIYRR